MRVLALVAAACALAACMPAPNDIDLAIRAADLAAEMAGRAMEGR